MWRQIKIEHKSQSVQSGHRQTELEIRPNPPVHIEIKQFWSKLFGNTILCECVLSVKVVSDYHWLTQNWLISINCCEAAAEKKPYKFLFVQLTKTRVYINTKWVKSFLQDKINIIIKNTCNFEAVKHFMTQSAVKEDRRPKWLTTFNLNNIKCRGSCLEKGGTFLWCVTSLRIEHINLLPTWQNKAVPKLKLPQNCTRLYKTDSHCESE